MQTSSSLTSTEQIAVVSPVSGETIGAVPAMGPEAVRAAVDRARRAQVAWGRLSVSQRAGKLKLFQRALVDNAESLADLIVRENGKPRMEALTHDVFALVDLIHYVRRCAPAVLRTRSIRLHLLKHRCSYLHFHPKGVVGIISPWNFPLFIPVGEVVPALIAGNAVVLKPSEVTPLVALEAKRLWDACGCEPDLFQVATGGAPTGQALIAAGINHLNFTGSVAAGRKVAAACGERLIPCSLELGGKAPAIVLADAPLERTARALVWGAFSNSGQTCVAVERVYAMRSIHDSLVERIVALTKELRQGDPSSTEIDLGAITFPRQLAVAEEQIADAVSKGARILTGGQRSDGASMAFPPTVIGDAAPEMRVMREETFGPLLPIMPVESEQEALRLANDSHLGLNAYVFSRDVPKALRLAECIEAGSVLVNDVLSNGASPETPWGGIKDSGIGRVRSEYGLLDLVEIRHVNYPRIPVPRELWWFPYGKAWYQLFLNFMRRFYR